MDAHSLAWEGMQVPPATVWDEFMRPHAPTPDAGLMSAAVLQYRRLERTWQLALCYSTQPLEHFLKHPVVFDIAGLSSLKPVQTETLLSRYIIDLPLLPDLLPHLRLLVFRQLALPCLYLLCKWLGSGTS